MPRHPPCALKNLTITHTTNTNPKGPATNPQKGPANGHARYTKFKMLASTMQFSNNNPSQHPTHTPHGSTGRHAQENQKPQQPHPTRNKPHTAKKPRPCNPSTSRIQPLLPQDPTVCHTPPNQQPTSPFHNPHPQPPQRREADTSPYSNQPAPTRHLSVDIPPMSTHRRTNACAMGLLLTTPTPHTTWTATVVGAP